MSKDKKRLVPVRRFKEFENADAWEQRKLGEVVERFDNLRIPVTSSKREKGITPYYGANGIQDYVQGYTHDGEFVLVAEDGANDLQNYPVHYVNGKVWVNNHAHVLQGKNKMVDNLFLVNAIKQIKIETYLVGGSRAKLNADVMMKLPIKVPTFNEQQKIGEYFSKFDTLITLHQRKLDKLKRVKSAYLTEMFPAEGEREPKRRFPGFTGAWEQRKLGDMGNVITGNTPSTKDKSNWTTDKNKGHIWITPTDINRKVLFDSERYLSDKGWLKARKIPKNSVLITSIASIGKNAINGIDAAFNQQINALILQNNNYYFVLSLMDKEKKRFEALAGQTATPIINKSTFSSFQLQIPSENEQNKIGNFFKKIDNLITLHQRKPNTPFS